MTDNNIEIAKILIARLERLSADSYWAHRASGIRGALIKIIEEENSQEGEYDFSSNTSILGLLIQKGYSILEKAAREIPDYK